MRRNRNGYMLIAMVLLSCLLGGCGQPPQEAASEPAEETRREAMSEMIQETTIQETIREAAIQETAVRETLQETMEEKTEILYSYEVRELDYVDEENLFLMGSSQGGAVSALAGAAQPEAVRGMILLYPAFILADRANELFSSVEEIPDTYYFMWMDVGRAYFEPLIGYDIYEDIAACAVNPWGCRQHCSSLLFGEGPGGLSLSPAGGNKRSRTRFWRRGFCAGS